MPFRTATISISPSRTTAPSNPDVRRALAAGFTPEEVRFMFALDVPDTTEVEIDMDDLVSLGSQPDYRATR
jgi:hypothetical protein